MDPKEGGTHWGWSRVLPSILSILAGAALLSILIMQHDVAQVLENQYVLIERLIDYIDKVEERAEGRHLQLMNVCLTMEERMCDTLCKRAAE